jgi:tRNA threonylcarbamoyl adenosine modification protein YjeE
MVIERPALSLPAMEALAREISLWARPGLALHLSGDLGAGKSAFARAFIRGLAPDDRDFDIPSPSFSLVQSYDALRVPVVHVDLYRIGSPTEVAELGLDEFLAKSLMIIEWPEKLPENLSPDCLKISISGSAAARDLKLEAAGKWIEILKRDELIKGFVKQSQVAGGTRYYFEGDASARRYERVSAKTETLLLMDMPRRPDGPVVKNGKPYSAIAHLAEGIDAVVGINDYLFKLDYSVPRIYTADVNLGMALIEPLGDRVFSRMMARGEDMEEPMKAAVEVLADMAKRDWPNKVPVRGGADHRIADYDLEAMMIEVDLLPSWFWPLQKKSMPGDEVKSEFAEIWQSILPGIKPSKPVWTLRDYHSPNLLWLPERQGLRRVGIIDTQDCVMGHPAYDLVSMLQDARVDIDFRRADELLDYYCGLRAAAGPFDAGEFSRVFAILGAQRATKILGIFARLSKRDGKPIYLNHIPRVSRYLKRNLAHPGLAVLKGWHDRNLPL